MARTARRVKQGRDRVVQRRPRLTSILAGAVDFTPRAGHVACAICRTRSRQTSWRAARLGTDPACALLLAGSRCREIRMGHDTRAQVRRNRGLAACNLPMGLLLPCTANGAGKERVLCPGHLERAADRMLPWHVATHGPRACWRPPTRVLQILSGHISERWRRYPC
jgi:hypothetical protein